MRIYKRAKIPNAMITRCDINCLGSITLGSEIMKRYGIENNEQVHVLGVTTKERAVTYVIEGEGAEICCNGGMANIFKVGDTVNIVAYEII